MRQARQARQAMMEPGARPSGLGARGASQRPRRPRQGFPVWLAPRWLAGLGANPRLGTACRSRAVTDPSRIVFGISPPPHARAPVARALTSDHGCTALPRHSRTGHSGPSSFRAPAAHDSQGSSSPPPPGGLRERLMAVDQHKEISRKRLASSAAHHHLDSSRRPKASSGPELKSQIEFGPKGSDQQAATTLTLLRLRLLQITFRVPAPHRH